MKNRGWLFAHSPPVWLSWVSLLHELQLLAHLLDGQLVDPVKLTTPSRPWLCSRLVALRAVTEENSQLDVEPAERRWLALGGGGDPLCSCSADSTFSQHGHRAPRQVITPATAHPKMPFKCKPSAPRVFLRQQGASLVNGQALKFSQRVARGKAAELAELQNITDLGCI